MKWLTPFYETHSRELGRLIILSDAGLFTEALQAAANLLQSGGGGSKETLAVTYLTQGIIYYKMGEQEVAIRSVSQAVAINPNSETGIVARDLLESLRDHKS